MKHAAYHCEPYGPGHTCSFRIVLSGFPLSTRSLSMARIRTTIDTTVEFVRRFPEHVVTVEPVSDRKRYRKYEAPCGCLRVEPETYGRHPISGWEMWLDTADGQTSECDEHCSGDDE